MFVLQDVVVFGAVDEEHHVGILLNGSRLTQVAQLRALAFKAVAVFYCSVELGKGEHGDVQLLGKTF